MKALAPAGIDPYAPGFLGDPVAAYRRLHEAGPVLWHAGLQGWLVTGHAAAREALADADSFPVMDTQANIADLAKRSRREFPTLAAVLSFVPFVLNPPAHTPVRRAAAGMLTARPMAHYQPLMREIAAQLLAAVRAARAFDAAADFADRLPALFMARLLGIAESELAGFLPHTEGVAKLFNRLLRLREYEELERQIGGGLERLRALAAERRRAPRDDVISRMAAKHGALSDAHIACYCYMMFLVGTETTAALIGGALRLLLDDAPLYQAVRADRALVRPLIEEALRLEPSVQLLTRTAARARELGGQQIAQGERLVVLLGAANRDPRAYPQPDRVELGRAGPGHIAFGEGTHTCVGATLARTETQVALEALLDLPPLRRRAAAQEWWPTDWLRRIRRLPLEFA